MKKFYDRVREMTELKELQRQAYNDYSRFVVLTGRRRVGKTSLEWSPSPTPWSYNKRVNAARYIIYIMERKNVKLISPSYKK